jgi:hypothetical protein
MSRMKFGVLLAALAALVVTSIAVAVESPATKFTSVTAQFTATGKVKAMTCTPGSGTAAGNQGSAGNAGTAANPMTIRVKRATFSGTATSSDSRLSGPVQITLRVHVGKNGLGYALGKYMIKGKITGDITAVVSETNKLDGIVRAGRRLFANFSATLNGSTLTGSFGSGSSSNVAIVNAGGCET